MPDLQHLLDVKGAKITSVQSSATVLEAVETMSRERVGSVLVFDNGQLSGIFTERDAVRRVLSRSLPPSQTRVSVVMTRDPVVAPPALPVREAMQFMSEKGVRHLPVGDRSGVIGVVSVGDIAKCAAQELDQELEEVFHYIGGPWAKHDSEWPASFLPPAPDGEPTGTAHGVRNDPER